MKHIKLFEQFIAEAKYTKLESVGSIIDQDGMVYPMTVSGKPDLDAGTPLDEIDREDDWYSSLSAKDKKIVAQYESVTEKQFKGLTSDQSLEDIDNDQKLKIIQSTGNIIDFKVPEWSDRNFWQVISKGKITKKKNLNGDTVYVLPGRMISSPAYSSIQELIDNVLWDSMEQRRRFNESRQIKESKNLNAIIDTLTNSMEYYDEDTFMDAAKDFGYDAETMKEIFNDYWALDAMKRFNFDTADWKKWLKSYK